MENLTHLASKIFDAQNNETAIVKLLLEHSESLLIKLDSHTENNDANFKEIHERVKFLETVIKGINGQDGLRKEVTELTKNVKKVQDDLKALLTKITIYVTLFSLFVAPLLIWGVQQIIKHLIP